MPVLPFAEYRPDVSDYSGQHTRRILNVLPRGDGYGPFPGFAVFSTALPDVCRGYFYARNQDGSVTIFAGTATRLYKLDNTNYTWSDVSKGGVAYPGVPTDDNWVFRQFNTIVIATQINTAPQAFTLPAGTFNDLGGSPPHVRYCDVVNRFLVLSGFDNTAPYRIQWSGYNNIIEWTPGASQSDSQDFPTGGIVRGVAGGETGYVFSDSAVRRMTYNPGSPAIFHFDIVEEDIGIYAPGSVIRARDRVFWLGPDGFKMLSPGSVPQNIGKEKVDRTFFAELDSNHLHCIIGAVDPSASRVVWAYRTLSAGGSSDCFNKLMVYDWALDRWAPINMIGQYITALARPGAITLESLDTISSSIDALPTPLDDFVESVLPAMSMFDDSNRLGFFSGANLEATMETPERGADGQRIYVRGFRPVTDADWVIGNITKKDRAYSAAEYHLDVLMDDNGFVGLHADTRFTRGVIRIPAGISWTFASGIEPQSRATGRR